MEGESAAKYNSDQIPELFPLPTGVVYYLVRPWHGVEAFCHLAAATLPALLACHPPYVHFLHCSNRLLITSYSRVDNQCCSVVPWGDLLQTSTTL